LLHPVADEALEICRVSAAVNSNRATGPDLWKTIAVGCGPEC